MSKIRKYCEGIDCAWCNEKEPCIYKIANELEDKLTAKEQSEEKLVKQIQTICDFINNRPETFKGVNGSVDKIITDYAERKEQECEELKLDLIEAKAHGDYLNNLALSETLNLVSEQLDQLKSELKSAKELREYTYDCCKQAGEELAKNSFEWDGKEKNLVVQAMELNERYDQLKVENETLKQYKLAQEQRVKTDVENNKYKQALEEIKEVATLSQAHNNKDYLQKVIIEILQKISECEVDSGN